MKNSRTSPLACGLSLAVTVAVLYLACAVVVAFAPESMVVAARLIVHGLNVSGIEPGPHGLSWSAVAAGTSVTASYAFVAGTLFGFVHRWIGGEP